MCHLENHRRNSTFLLKRLPKMRRNKFKSWVAKDQRNCYWLSFSPLIEDIFPNVSRPGSRMVYLLQQCQLPPPLLCCGSQQPAAKLSPPIPPNTLSQGARQIWRIFTKYPRHPPPHLSPLQRIKFGPSAWGSSPIFKLSRAPQYGHQVKTICSCPTLKIIFSRPWTTPIDEQN